MADLVVNAGQQDENILLDAVGPDIFTFEELVRLIAGNVHLHVMYIHTNPGLAFYLAKLIEPVVGDVLITHNEIAGLMANLLFSQKQPRGLTQLSACCERTASTIGTNNVM